MIHLSSIAVENQSDKDDNWQTLLSQSRISTEQLLDYLGLSHHPLADTSAESLFELRVPRPYLEKIERGNPYDPLLLQILPQKSEHLAPENYVADPLQEKDFTPVKGLIHKYQSRVLLIASQVCAINCRYCFRREFPYQEHRLSRQQWDAPLNYITEHPEVNEVILSGGDPLVHHNDYLFNLLEQIDAIPSVHRIRIHSRLLVSLPQRVDTVFLNRLESLRCRVIIVMHCNHPNELGEDVASALSQLSRRNVLLLNQSVLLKDVNDDARILAQLSERLFDMSVQPYYLFTLDRVSGAAHFDMPRARARRLYRELLSRLPGYLVPRLVEELPGEASKSPIDLRSFSN